MLNVLSTRRLASFSTAALSCFFLALLALHPLEPQHHLMTDALSDYAHGRFGLLLQASYASAAIGGLAVALCLRRSLPRSTACAIAIGLIGASSLLGLIPAVFVNDLAGHATTTSGSIHTLASVTSFVMLMTAMLLTGRVFARAQGWQHLRRPTLINGILSIALFLAVGSQQNGPSFGLLQRIFIVALFGWLLTLAAIIRTRQGTLGSPATQTPPDALRADGAMHAAR